MNLEKDTRTTFYEFATISDEKTFKNNYHHALNNLPIDQETGDRIVDKANCR